ncbi:MAG TPA: CocE/NonD family hydrolase [Nitrospiraceae bacterium]|nr:CocE/NonD family hydrolase [Nitrospiraceae bacterium]
MFLRSTLVVFVLACGALAVYHLAGRAGSAMPWIEEDAMVPMRDGVRLYTKIWRPLRPGRYPVVFSRGYNHTGPAFAEPFTKTGYVYVGQATRGHGLSEGERGVADRFFQDGADGYDALTWIARQPWSDGQIAMYGKSYWAATQWLASLEQHPNLKAIIPQVMSADIWQCVYWCNGALSLGLTASGRAYEKSSWDSIRQLGPDRYFRHLPLINLDEVADGARTKGARELWKAYVSHSTFDPYWQAISLRADGKDGKYQKITIPVFLMGGWYDYYAGAAFTSFQRLKEVGATREIRLVINPSDHLNRIVGDRDFGPDAPKDEITLAVRWLDYLLKGIDNGVPDEPPIRIFVMGINRWRGEHEWPLARTQFTKYYFHAADGSKTGLLDRRTPHGEPPSVYTYDPDDPVPTIGGNHSFIDGNLAGILRAGAYDQRPNENRPDVLVWSTPPLETDLEVTGPVRLTLYAASSAPDTDFTAKLIDVYPDGTAYNLTEGIIRARFRRSVWDAPELLTPGRIYEFGLDLQPTSNVFRAGHRIRVHLTSSNFPLWDRNPNTGHRQGMDGERHIARQTVYHDAAHPSHILLPVIPQTEQS